MSANEVNLSSEDKFCVFYHSIFDYSLSMPEIIKWKPGEVYKKFDTEKISVKHKNQLYYLTGSKGVILKKNSRKAYSLKGIKKAYKNTNILRLFPFVKLVCLTGSLPMLNAQKTYDIDLLLVVSKNTLWAGRIIISLTLKLFGIPLRRYSDSKNKIEREKLCLNIWLEEDSITWPAGKRNFYTAHEICHMIPLIDKEGSYKLFLSKNKWVKKYWPNAVKVPKVKKIKKTNISIIRSLILTPINKVCFWLQYLYMKRKITNEYIAENKALFHPNDVSKKVVSRLNTIRK